MDRRRPATFRAAASPIRCGGPNAAVFVDEGQCPPDAKAPLVCLATGAGSTQLIETV